MRVRISGLMAAAAISLAATGCGFDDKLTSRGFIEEGDRVCASAAGESYVDVQRSLRRGAGDEQAIRALARGYGSIAAGVRELDVIDDDEAMRDALVERYGQASARIEEAARSAAAGDPNAAADALTAVNDLQPFTRSVRAYGFKVCGGRATPSEA
jgi:hypothetical protein